MTEQIHIRTFEELGSKAKNILESFNHEIKKVNEESNASYFAPFLYSQRINFGLHDALPELASLEWTLFHTKQLAGSWIRGSMKKMLRINPSLSLLRCEYDIWSLYLKESTLKNIEKKPSVLAVYTPPNTTQPQIMRILPEWAIILDSLADGDLTEKKLISTLSEKFHILFPKSRLEAHLENLKTFYLLESEIT